MMIKTLGSYQLAVVWNHPVWALSYGRWKFQSHEDDRQWFMRTRVGPFKVQVTKGER